VSERPWRVLIVDDNPDDRAELRRLLLERSERRYTLSEAETGAQCLEIVVGWESGPAQCVLLDFHLPDMNALEILRALAAPDGSPRYPVVVVTGSDATATGRAVILAGAQDFIGKDWLSPQGLTRAVENAIERWTMSADLRRQRDSLAASEALFRTLFELGAAGMVQIDASSRRFIRANHRFCEMTGYSVDELRGMRPADLTHHEDRAADEAPRARLVVGDTETYEIEKRYVGKDGRLLWVAVSTSLLRTSDGKPWQTMAVVIDITARKEAEFALLVQRVDLQALADNTPDILTRFDRSLRHVFVNAAVEKATGRKREEFLGKTNRELGMPTSQCDLWDAAISEVFETRQTKEIEFAFISPAGERRYAARLVPELAPNGSVDSVLGLTADVTERRRLEAAAQASEASLRMSLAAAQAGSWDWDVATGDIVWSPENFLLYGYEPSEVGPSYADWEARIHPDDRASTNAHVQAALSRAVTEFHCEFRVIHPARGMRTLLGLGKVDFDPSGAPLRMTGINLDVTERKAMDEALRRQSQQKTDFLAILAHELRNPLAPLSNGLELLRTSPDSKIAAIAQEMMRRQLSHLVRLINDLLDVSRINQGRIEIVRAPMDLRTAIDHAMEIARPHIESAGHRVSVVVPESPVWVYGDHVRLCQVFSNLLNNACKYSPPGAAISVFLEVEGDEAVGRVTDTGDGIDAAMLSRVFDLFAQVSDGSAQSRDGLGIGLYLVRQLLVAQDGSIHAESPGLGRGSTFTARLPIVATVEVAKVSTMPTTVPSGTSRLSKRVLIVDDNVDAADSLAMLLLLNGHEVKIAHAGRPAIEIAASGWPEAAFIDIGLPDMSGYEVAHQLRSINSLKNATLTALTGWGAASDRERSAASGFDFHITKPADVAELDDILAGVRSDRVRALSSSELPPGDVRRTPG
jgi:PAS domain S-box-containing protein